MRAFRIAYDGTGYHGFQRQPSVSTVEGALFDACRALGAFDDDAGRPPGYAAAGRTDAGVSALAQTVAFDAPEWCRPRALNGELPARVRAWAAADAPPEFHATHDAAARTYDYHLYAPDADPERARAALDALAGPQDLHNLTPDGRGTERTLTTGLRVDSPYLVCRFRAGGFPRHFVRRAVALVDGVARGERTLADVERVLAPDSLPGHRAPGTAPPEPLALVDVDYPDLTFERDERAVESAVDVFEGLRVERRTGARIAGTLADGIGGDATDAAERN